VTDQATTASLGEAAPPLVNGVPEEVADGVFVIADGRVPLVPNIGVIVGEHAALVVDTGMGPRNGETVRRIATELAGDRPLFLTLTHFHPEHGYGAQAFRDVTIVYNRAQRDEFRAKASGYLDTFKELGDHVARELEGVEFVDPQIVYDGSCDLDLGGKVVRLRTWGAAHSLGDQVVHLPAERVMFCGDLVENRFFPIFPFFPPYDVDVDGDKWIETLEELERLAPAVVVPGHGELSDASLIAINRKYLELLRSETARLAAEGNDADTIIGTLIPQLLGQHSDWDPSEPWRIATGVQSFLAR
jgi:glyoxylase-like metal-dependent hydrolase (beta-lactamase superfamily II)